MPDTRYALRNGDKTTTGGILIATGDSMTHHGVKVGVEGDHATCPACKAGGPVMNDCYPAFNVHGKQILVSGARVYCKCPKPPLVIHSQTNFTIEVNRVEGGASLAQPPYYSSALDDDEEIVEQYLEIVNLDTDEKVENHSCDLYVDGDLIVSNKKMNNGCTQSVPGKCEVSAVIWHDWSSV